MTLNDILEFAGRPADAAGDAIRPHFRTRFDVETKTDSSPVTVADRAAEAAMRALIEIAFPADGIIGEEYGNVREDAGRVGVLAPIAGTRSLITGRPIFGTLVALVEDKWPGFGVSAHPHIGHRWPRAAR